MHIKTIVVLVIYLALSIRVTADTQGCPDVEQCWTTQDIIDSRIDVHAQKAIISMLNRGGIDAKHAGSMLCAVKRGQLDGIYLPDQQVPALRAINDGGWWSMIPQGKLSECYGQSSTEEPLIVFRKEIKNDMESVILALNDSWNSCNINISAGICYSETISRPSDPIVSIPGHGSLQVTVLWISKAVERAKVSIQIGSGVTEDRITDSRGRANFQLLPGEWNIKVTAGSNSSVGNELSEPNYEFFREDSIKIQSEKYHLKVINFSVPTSGIEKCTSKTMDGAFRWAQDICMIESVGPGILCSGRIPDPDSDRRCSQSIAEYYENCVPNLISESASSMDCVSGSTTQILNKYRSWPGRIR